MLQILLLVVNHSLMKKNQLLSCMIVKLWQRPVSTDLFMDFRYKCRYNEHWTDVKLFVHKWY